MPDKNVRLLAFHFPQYHPFPENEALWGKGFTEWTNVTKARPLFRGHYQPHLPTDLGFYDLRVPETRQAQADLAREYGIHGFCYYHYWLHGHRLMNAPIDAILESGKPDFPFCFCWANESWTKKWDGLEEHVLVKQDYSDEDDLQHIRWLVKAFKDKRYIKIDGKPFFAIYRALRLPNPLKTTNIWREEARRLGIGELYLCRVESNFADEMGDPTAIGFDAAIEFQPDSKNIGPPMEGGVSTNAWKHHGIFDYSDMVRRMLRKEAPTYKRYPCVTPGWDNSARRASGAVIIKDSTPQVYGEWLETVIRRFTPYSTEENFAFVCAWNEWAEGNHLEPDRKWGRAYLEATYTALQRGLTGPPPQADMLSSNACLGSDPSQFDVERIFALATSPTMTAKERQKALHLILNKLDASGFFLRLYNLGSLLSRQNNLAIARKAFEITAELSSAIDPQLAGKSYYKLSSFAAKIEEKAEHLEACLQLLPSHQAAQSELNRIKGSVVQ
ncbi:MAG: glycoside hydrolase family 99-like domain-containing protein [Acidobacteria bacterium]|nr:glycoside hydrolase family 99-like domain-containing protein [Acidobacteriota bacterium]